MLGRDLETLLQRARDYKKEYNDSFVAVEHLVLGFVQDKRFGKQLFKDFQISMKALTDAVQAIRGRQTVIDQGKYRLCKMLLHVIFLRTCIHKIIYIIVFICHSSILTLCTTRISFLNTTFFKHKLQLTAHKVAASNFLLQLVVLNIASVLHVHAKTQKYSVKPQLLGLLFLAKNFNMMTYYLLRIFYFTIVDMMYMCSYQLLFIYYVLCLYR